MATDKYRYYLCSLNNLLYRSDGYRIECSHRIYRDWSESAYTVAEFKEEDRLFTECGKDGESLDNPVDKPHGKPTVMQVFRLLTRSGRRRSWDIADYLHGLGVKGYRHSEASCPIANFFKKHGIDAEVKTNGILADGKIWDLPDGVKYFVEGFDCGDWPALKA